MAYACEIEKDVQFEQWIHKYEKTKSGFSNNQYVNFKFMKKDFLEYLAVIEHGNFKPMQKVGCA